MKYKQLPQEKINPDKAFEIHRRVCNRELQRRALLAENIIDLQTIFDKQLYKAILGFDPPPKWSGYLGQIELYYSRSKVERWRKILLYFGSLKYNLAELLDIPDTRLEDIVKVGEIAKEKVDLLLGQARELPSLEWRNAIAEVSGRPTSWECQHSMHLKQVCSKCGLSHEVVVDKSMQDSLKIVESNE